MHACLALQDICTSCQAVHGGPEMTHSMSYTGQAAGSGRHIWLAGSPMASRKHDTEAAKESSRC